MTVGPRPNLPSCAIFSDAGKLIGHIIRPLSNPVVYRAIFLDYKHKDCATYDEALAVLAATV